MCRHRSECRSRRCELFTQSRRRDFSERSWDRRIAACQRKAHTHTREARGFGLGVDRSLQQEQSGGRLVAERVDLLHLRTVLFVHFIPAHRHRDSLWELPRQGPPAAGECTASTDKFATPCRYNPRHVRRGGMKPLDLRSASASAAWISLCTTM